MHFPSKSAAAIGNERGRFNDIESLGGGESIGRHQGWHPCGTANRMCKCEAAGSGTIRKSDKVLGADNLEEPFCESDKKSLWSPSTFTWLLGLVALFPSLESPWINFWRRCDSLAYQNCSFRVHKKQGSFFGKEADLRANIDVVERRDYIRIGTPEKKVWSSFN